MTDVVHRPSVAATAAVRIPVDAPAVSRLVRPAVQQAKHRSRRVTLTLRVLVPAAVFGLWWLLTSTGVIPPTTLSSPGTTWHTFVNLLVHQGLVGDVGISLARAAVGLAI